MSPVFVSHPEPTEAVGEILNWVVKSNCFERRVREHGSAAALPDRLIRADRLSLDRLSVFKGYLGRTSNTQMQVGRTEYSS